MSLRPDVSITTSLAVAGLVYGVFQISLPTVTDVRAASPGDSTIGGTERAATWIAGAVVAGVSLIARDMNIFILGGAMTVALAWHYRHANQYNQLTDSARTMINSANVLHMAPEQATQPIAETPDTDYAFG
jgi:hypothetical protein